MLHLLPSYLLHWFHLLVTDIGLVVGVAGLTVNPSPFITVLSPAGVLNSADVKSFNSFAGSNLQVKQTVDATNGKQNLWI